MSDEMNNNNEVVNDESTEKEKVTEFPNEYEELFEYHELDYTHEQIESLFEKIDKGFLFTKSQYDQLINKIGLENISVFDGKYESLTGRPYIPVKVSDLENDLSFQDAEKVNEKILLLEEGMINRINNIQLTPGPKGDKGEDGKDFTYDMFTEEQLQALRGEKGEQGPQGEAGPAGENGKDFTYDMFTEEQLAALKGDKGEMGPEGPAGKDGAQGPQGPAGEKGPQGEVGPQGPQGIQGEKGDAFKYEDFTAEQLEALRGSEGPMGPQGPAGKDAEVNLDGYATEEYVQDAIKNIQAGEEVDLTEYAKMSYVDEKIAAVELMPGPQGEQGPAGEPGKDGEQGPQGEMGPEGPAGKDFTYDMFTEEQLEALRGPQGEQGPQGPAGKDADPMDLSDYAKISYVDEKVAAIKHPQYDDSEIRELIDEEKPYLANISAYPTSKFLFACGQPMTVEPNVGQKYDANMPEDAVAFVYRWAEGFEAIMVEKEEAAKVYLVGGYGINHVNVKRPIPQTNMVVRDVKIKGLVGGSYFEGMVGHINIEAENCEFVSVMGAGWCGASVDGKITRMNIADDINIKMTNCKISSTFFGGTQGNGVADDVHVELNNCEIGWLTAGGSNGMTRNAEIVMNGGSVKVAQSTNRGVVNKARFVLNDGVVEKLYFGGETEDGSVDGLIEKGFVELNGGTVKQFNFGTNNGIEMQANEIKGSIFKTVVESGDVSMLEIKIEEEQKPEVDLTEYAKIQYVDEKIAAIPQCDPYDDSEIKERVEALENINHDDYLKEHQDISHLAAKKDVDAMFALRERYEISNCPKGTLIDYREKEIRIMCPEDAEFKQQQVGEGGNANMYYMTFTTYFPENAVTFKEGDKGVLVDEVLNFENTTGTGIDEYGRKYKQHWFALASFNGTSWTYYGKTSSIDKYIGWTYCVEWYDENGVAIGNDCIRLNLSNEDSHLAMQPYHGFRMAERSYVDEQIANIELKEGPAGAQGEKGEDGAQGPQGEKGEKGDQGEMGPEGPMGPQGKDGEQGISVQSFEIKDNHLMVELSNGEIVDAGEFPVCKCDDTNVSKLEAELAEAKQRLADLTYGVDYEWIYYYKQEEASRYLGFNEENAPLFWAEYLENAESEDWWMQFLEKDNYRLYALRVSEDNKNQNRYDALIPFEDNTVQVLGEGFYKWNILPADNWCWNFDGDRIELNYTSTSCLCFAFMKVRH